MPSLNKVFLMGHLTREPELKYAAGTNNAVCKIGLATGGKRKTAQGREIDDTCFVDITVFGKSAEMCSRSCHKGSCVFVEGRLNFESWQDRATGERKSRLSVLAERIQFLNLAKREDRAAGASGGGNNFAESMPSPEMDDVPF